MRLFFQLFVSSTYPAFKLLEHNNCIVLPYAQMLSYASRPPSRHCFDYISCASFGRFGLGFASFKGSESSIILSGSTFLISLPFHCSSQGNESSKNVVCDVLHGGFDRLNSGTYPHSWKCARNLTTEQQHAKLKIPEEITCCLTEKRKEQVP